MTEKPPAELRAATARVKTGHSLSIVWVVPLLALLIGGWLAFKAISEKGPTVTISFVSAEGLEAGKTRIRYRDVEIGKVEEIRFSDDLSKVLVTAQLAKESEKFLTDKTRFWVVRARVSGGTVTGLSTVLSGAYIGVDPSLEGNPTRDFTGLEVPPVVTIDQPGRHFRLRADRLGSLDVGAPVYYRQIPVGQVVSYGFSQDGKAVDIQIFVEAPHHARVTENSRFWNASGMDISLDTEGLRIETESLISIIGGGIAFDLPNDIPPGKEAGENTDFRLYPNRDSIQEKTYAVRHYWMLLFDHSVRGLSVGSPVELHGIKVGEVVSLDLEYNQGTKDFRVPVIIAIEPERIRGIGDTADKTAAGNSGATLRWLVERRGLRAQLKSGNLMTGQLLVDLDFHPVTARVTLAHRDGYPVIPTTPAALEQLQESLARITSELEKVPFEQIGADLQKTLKEATATFGQAGEAAGTLNAETLPQLQAALADLQKTLIELQGTVGRESPLNYNVNKAFEELSLTLQSLRELTTTLERQPQSIIFGKEGDVRE